MTDLLKICKSQYTLEDLRAKMMALNPNLVVTSFFNENGSPYSMQEICEMAQRELQYTDPGNKSRVRAYLEYLTTTDGLVDLGVGAGVTWFATALSNLNISLKEQLTPTYLKKFTKNYLAGMGVGTAIALFVLSHMDRRDNRKIMQALNDKIGKAIRAWESEKYINREFPKGIHQQIQQGCGATDSTSIRDIRVWVMTHHPDATARVLIHPTGRLFTEREICVALKVFGNRLKAKPSAKS